jgi:acetyltransferase-like isoleucine patch superfamily enzyme
MDDNAIISDFVFILAEKYLKIGKYSRIGPQSILTGGGEILIGDFVDISYAVKIISVTDDIYGEYLITPCVPSQFRNVYHKKVVIRNYSFI